MPGGDRTGPRGQGPTTGRAAGFCNGNDTPGYDNPQRVRGFGRGGGMGFGGGGRGRRNRFNATGLTGWQRAQQEGEYGPQPQKPSLLSAIHSQIGAVQEALSALNERIAQLESRTDR